MCKVQWSHHTKEEGTSIREEELKTAFQNFFFDPSESRGKIYFKGGRFVIPRFSQENKTLENYLYK
jgi:hypothetical protein